MDFDRHAIARLLKDERTVCAKLASDFGRKRHEKIIDEHSDAFHRGVFFASQAIALLIAGRDYESSK